jgi:DNA-binding protein YbaB
MDGHTWVDGYRSRLAQIRTAAARSRERVEVEATASSREGAVTVTVDALGVVRRVLFTAAAGQLTWVQLADAVVAAAGRARAQAAVEALGRRVGVP